MQNISPNSQDILACILQLTSKVDQVIGQVGCLRSEMEFIKTQIMAASSSGSSAEKVRCPLGCSSPGFSRATYLMDHLHRCCHISQRLACQHQQAGCEFSITKPEHSQLWYRVFGVSGAAETVENVLAPLTLHHLWSHALHRSVSSARS